jgi:hypothetical protein
MDCTTTSEMETACLAENERRFQQAGTTPFLVEPLMEAFGLLGHAPVIQQVLDGTYIPPPNTDENAKLLLRQMSQPRTAPICVAEYRQAWYKATERTSSGPSNLHFGHHKAGAQNDILAQFETTMLNVVYLSGYSPNRWRKGLNIMIEKKPGCVEVEKLRTILLYKADFNMHNMITGYRMMRNAEQHDLLAPEQYGSRKGKRSILQVANKVLVYDLLRQRRKPGAVCSNDAKSCYDRIVHSVAKIDMMRCGIGANQVDAMFSTIQRLEHFIRTAHGDTSISY